MSKFEQVMNRAFWIVGLLLVISITVIVITRGLGVTWNLQWEVWTVATALGTVGATAIALWLASRGAWRERNQIARVVSVWVTDEYLEREDEPAYRRRVVLHVTNESDEPIFNARVNVMVNDPPVRLGPLTAPPVLSVIPPRRELTFDLTVPFRAHEGTWSPRAEMFFTDPSGRRWNRTAAGELHDVTGEASTWSATVPFDERQFGRQDSFDNPMLVAVSFLSSLIDGTPSAELTIALAPEAAGWAQADWAELRERLEGFNPTSMVDYVTPCIARVKLVNAPDLEGRSVVGEGMALPIEVQYVTLTRSASRGWRIFSVGGTNSPDEIPLPDDAFASGDPTSGGQ